jgi:serine/threonine protein kinase
VMRPSLCRLPEAVRRFRREARAATQVGSKHIVDVTDFGTTPTGSVFFVMEYLEGGQDLDTVLKKSGRLPWKRVVHIVAQLCDALQAAHDAGIIHRDVKPANFYRVNIDGDEDFIKVLDFGIARLANPTDSIVTQTGVVMGTPDYMAPEQACEQPLDHRVDVYAAGGLFFELLTGRKPYLGKSTAELLAAHLHKPVPDPGHLVPSLSVAVREIVTKAMAKDRDDRFGSMAEMSAAIADAVAAGDDDDEIALLRGPRRRAAAAMLAVGVLALGGWLVSEPPVSPKSAPPTEVALPTAIEAPEPSPPPVHVAPAPRREPVTIATIEPPVDPAPVVAEAAAPSVPRSAEPKRARKSTPREHVELPPVMPDESPPVETPPIADAEPMRSRITEVKDPFASDGEDVLPRKDVEDRGAAEGTTIPDVGVGE